MGQGELPATGWGTAGAPAPRTKRLRFFNVGNSNLRRARVSPTYPPSIPKEDCLEDRPAAVWCWLTTWLRMEQYVSASRVQTSRDRLRGHAMAGAGQNADKTTAADAKGRAKAGKKDSAKAGAAASVLDRLFAGGRVLSDGAMGTMLYDRGIFINRCFDELNLSQPEIVAGVHAEYLQAGAEIVETNTFGANAIPPGALRPARQGARDQPRRSPHRPPVRCADREKQATEAFVAGAIGPLGVPLAPKGELTLDAGARGVCGTDRRAGRGRAGRGRGPAHRRNHDLAGRGGRGHSRRPPGGPRPAHRRDDDGG